MRSASRLLFFKMGVSPPEHYIAVISTAFEELCAVACMELKRCFGFRFETVNNECSLIDGWQNKPIMIPFTKGQLRNIWGFD